jgi:hypothetical protein
VPKSSRRHADAVPVATIDRGAHQHQIEGLALGDLHLQAAARHLRRLDALDNAFDEAGVLELPRRPR